MRANFTLAVSRVVLKIIHRWLTVLCLLLVSTTVNAHQTGNSYLNISQVDGRIAVDLDFFVRDLGSLLESPSGADEPAPYPGQASRTSTTHHRRNSAAFENRDRRSPYALEFFIPVGGFT
ncbi:MAG: hypothetical protein O3A05_09460 [Proteobacteria bacterium]|nr:hypothetical protein [Pseudomonadota bacterium]MDA1012408.1 hypothetical protein [Pseudomonadota bacterium]